MPEPEPFDPTHALDGWRPPAPLAMPDLALDALLHAGGAAARPLQIGTGSATFDPTHLLDGWRPPAPAPLDLELKSLQRAGAGPDEATLARLKARGYEMLDVEDIELTEVPASRVVTVEAWEPEMPPAPPLAEVDVALGVDVPLPEEGAAWPLFTEEAQVMDAAPGIEDKEEPPTEPPPPQFLHGIQLPEVAPPADVEAPVLDFHVAPPPPEPDPSEVIASIELPEVVPQPAVGEAPELDMAALAPRAPERDPRLLAQWKAGAWTALARRVAAASEELTQTPAGPRVESRAPQWLCAVWPPQAAEDASLGRWPELAALVAAESATGALQELLAELPHGVPLWSADLETDWDLVAELVLHQDTGLRPAQQRALRELAEAELNARLARFSAAYALQGRVVRRRA